MEGMDKMVKTDRMDKTVKTDRMGRTDRMVKMGRMVRTDKMAKTVRTDKTVANIHLLLQLPMYIQVKPVTNHPHQQPRLIVHHPKESTKLLKLQTMVAIQPMHFENTSDLMKFFLIP